MHYFEATELAARVLGIDPDAADFDEDEVEQKIYDKFDVSMESFQQIAEALLPFTPTAETAVTQTVVHGYVFGSGFITKTPVKQDNPH